MRCNSLAKRILSHRAGGNKIKCNDCTLMRDGANENETLRLPESRGLHFIWFYIFREELADEKLLSRTMMQISN